MTHPSGRVWIERFELPTPCSQSRCPAKLGHIQLALGTAYPSCPQLNVFDCGFDPATLGSQDRCSATELSRIPVHCVFRHWVGCKSSISALRSTVKLAPHDLEGRPRVELGPQVLRLQLVDAVARWVKSTWSKSLSWPRLPLPIGLPGHVEPRPGFEPGL